MHGICICCKQQLPSCHAARRSQAAALLCASAFGLLSGPLQISLSQHIPEQLHASLTARANVVSRLHALHMAFRNTTWPLVM